MTSSCKIPKERRLQVYNTVSASSVIVLLFWCLLLLPNGIFGKTVMINGVAVDTTNSRQLNFALFDAVEFGRMEDVRQLMELGASVEARNRFGNTALLLAARKGHLNIVQLLLDAGSELHYQNLSGDTALFQATRARRRKVVKYLLGSKAKVNVVNRQKLKSLIAAAYNGDSNTVQLL